MRSMVNGLFDDVFAVFSTMAWVKDFFKTNPQLSHEETNYTMQLNNCVNRTAYALVDLQDVINVNENVLDLSKNQNAINYISKFLELGDEKRLQIADALSNFVEVNDGEKELQDKVAGIHVFAEDAVKYSNELRRLANENPLR